MRTTCREIYFIAFLVWKYLLALQQFLGTKLHYFTNFDWPLFFQVCNIKMHYNNIFTSITLFMSQSRQCLSHITFFLSISLKLETLNMSFVQPYFASYLALFCKWIN